ncbi:pyruvate kinase protein [Trichomonas vaginalis G3]|uniref:pyruvate kinase protein n=1 Tax=Trichomonas vaginalis (strain ATCC PRA-98 / G3) TaxID=412133 RepID=UPI0021E54A8C|nr:pyruvate kinase protein [Trichomonas vaginalis G3]KAI5484421.1 pyruvate kinase protein [Trichomonas vaginalis G3]
MRQKWFLAHSKTCYRIGVKAIISLTASGQSAVKIARNRPECDILAVTHTDQIARVLTMVWGVTPVLLIKADRLNLMLASTIKGLLQNKSIADNHTYIMTAGYPTGFVGSLNYVRILRKEQIEYYSNVQNKDLK